MKPTLMVTVISPQQILYQGPALSISSKNSSGNFDILPEHANMITFIENSPIVLKLPNNQKQEFKFPLAIIYITQNQAKVYAQPEIIQI